MARKFYVIWQGRQTGIFTDWTICKPHIDGYAGARYKSYGTRAQAEAALAAGADASLGKSRPAARQPSGRGPKTWTTAEIDALEVDVKIFTDGGCEPNPGKAGSGLVVYRDGVLAELWYGLYDPSGTNNTAELTALHQALCMAEGEITAGRKVAILADSSYAIQCVTKWAFGWQKRGWRKSGGDIKNLELIRPMHALYAKLADRVQVLHVNGHVGVEGNELADRMSVHGIDRKETAFVRYPTPDDPAVILALRTG